MSEHLNDLLNQLRDRDSGREQNGGTDFPPLTDLKQEFFRRAALADAECRRRRFRRVLKWAAVVMLFVVAAAAVLPAPHSARKISVPKDAEEIRITGKNETTDERANKLKDHFMPGTMASMEMKRSKVYEGTALRVDGDSFGSRSNDMCLPRPVTFNTEEYKNLDENPFLSVADHPLSTFGADVDTASYSNLRRMILKENRLPVRDAVRIEEMLNYFRYDYPAPRDGEDFNVRFELGDCPWAKNHKLLLVGVQARRIPAADLPPSNYVFLVDNSGSMYGEMPLVIDAMSALLKNLRDCDRVSLITYGGGVSVLLDSVPGSAKGRVEEALRSLQSGGFTPGAAGIQKAYELAHRNFIAKGNNRIVLITDGDFNVGVASESELVSIVEKERQSGIYLTAVGVGSGNYKDNKMKMLANKGNGNYIYLDSAAEARNALVNDATGRMFTLGRDVKFQIEFNPAAVAATRLIGYELRKLADRDFNDDSKDSGEVGVGHQVTALYELVPADAPAAVRHAAAGSTDPLKYQSRIVNGKEELLTFKLRYRSPSGNAPSVLRTFPLRAADAPKSANWDWASAVAECGLLLRNSPHKGTAAFDTARTRAAKCLGDDADGARAEFLVLTARARELTAKALKQDVPEKQ